MVAHRTSPTNIGLYLLAAACAQRFGWIGTAELLERLEATLATLARLPRHRGHFLNWYDTSSAAGAAAAVRLHASTAATSARTCSRSPRRAWRSSREPLATTALRRALAASATRIALLRAAGGEPLGGEALAAVLGGASPLERIEADPARFQALLDAAAAELRRERADRRSTSRCRRRRTGSPGRSRTTSRPCARRCATRPSGLGDDAVAARLQRIATTCRALAAEPDFTLPVRPQAPPVPHRLSRRRAPARRRLLRPARLGGARDQPVGDRQGRRAAAPLGRARPAVLRRRRARRPALVVGLDVRVPDADAGARRAARQRPAQRRARRRARADRLRARRTTCRGASRSRRTPAATTRSPTSTRRRACRAWRCAARRPTSSWSRPTPPRWPRRSRRTAPRPTCAALEALRARGRYGFIEALDYSPGAPVGRRGRRPRRAPSWRTTRA